MEEDFQVDRYYAFIHTYYTLTPPRRVETKLLVLKPLYISGEHICFPLAHWENGWQDKVLIAKKKIFAIGDMVHGNIGIVGYKGKYRIINSELFSQYYVEEVIDIKSVP